MLIKGMLINKYENIKNKILYKILRMKIRTKLFLAFSSIILLISVSVTLGVTFLTSKIVKDYSLEISTELTSQVSNNIKSGSNEVLDYTYSLIQNQPLKELLYRNQSNRQAYLKSMLQSKIREHFSANSLTNPFLKSVMIKTVNNEIFLWEKGDTSFSQSKSTKEQAETAFDQVQSIIEKGQIEPMWMSSTIDESAFLLLRPIIDEDNVDRHLGYILFEIDNKQLIKIEQDNTIISFEQISIIKESGEPLIKGGRTIQELFLMLKEAADYDKQGINYMLLNSHSEEYLLIEDYIPSLNWKVMCFVSQDEINKGKQSLQMLVLIISFISICITGYMAYVISRNISKNIRIIESNMRKFEDGDFNIRIKPESYDEVGLIGLRFNFMALKTRQLIDSLNKAHLEKQQAEFEVLKAQINPHFLYNTLGSVKWIAMSKGYKEVESIVSALIILLKRSIKGKSVYQTLEKEIDYIKNYLIIQKACLDGEIEVVYDIDEKLLGHYVLSFILQPIVENAIFHGLELTKDNQKISIRAFEEDKNLYLEVVDNGIGMDQQKLENLLLDDGEKDYSGLNSIGIKNVNQRMKIYFGEEYGLTFTSELGIGTKVVFVLPIIYSIKEDDLF